MNKHEKSSLNVLFQVIKWLCYIVFPVLVGSWIIPERINENIFKKELFYRIYDSDAKRVNEKLLDLNEIAQEYTQNNLMVRAKLGGVLSLTKRFRDLLVELSPSGNFTEEEDQIAYEKYPNLDDMILSMNESIESISISELDTTNITSLKLKFSRFENSIYNDLRSITMLMEDDSVLKQVEKFMSSSRDIDTKFIDAGISAFGKDFGINDFSYLFSDARVDLSVAIADRDMDKVLSVFNHVTKFLMSILTILENDYKYVIYRNIEIDRFATKVIDNALIEAGDYLRGDNQIEESLRMQADQ